MAYQAWVDPKRFQASRSTSLSYDALSPRGKRRAINSRVVREDHHTKGSKRRKLQENASELCRNMSLAGWMVRRHLDYVANFEFHGRTGIDELDDQLERLMEEDARPSKNDVSGRFGREKMFRLAEARRVIDGDCVLVKMNDLRLQGIQGDLVKDPNNIGVGETWVDGVLIGRTGRPLSFALWRRNSDTGTEYVRRINSTNVIHYGFFDRFAGDQVRGISPLTSALNPMRDIYENFDYALAKSKVSQLFALSIFRDGAESMGTIGDDEEGPIDETTGDPTNKKVDFGTGPQLLDLEPGERAEFLESKTPSTEFQDFTRLVTQAALKALDIPFSFYDESFTNFSGSRGAWMHYERACLDKRADQIEMRRQYTIWKIAGWIRDGRLTLPPGMRILDVVFEWVPRGTPWWQPEKEIQSHVQAMKAGLDSPQRICRATGSDFYRNVDQLKKAKEYAEKAGVPLEFVLSDQQIIQVEQAE